jgi:hypothetical protein
MRGGGWLTPGDPRRSNARDITAGLLKFEAYCLCCKEMGETMNIQHSAKYPSARGALAAQDFLMVSAFGVWALLLGLPPVLVFHALT